MCIASPSSPSRAIVSPSCVAPLLGDQRHPLEIGRAEIGEQRYPAQDQHALDRRNRHCGQRHRVSFASGADQLRASTDELVLILRAPSQPGPVVVRRPRSAPRARAADRRASWRPPPRASRERSRGRRRSRRGVRSPSVHRARVGASMLAAHSADRATTTGPLQDRVAKEGLGLGRPAGSRPTSARSVLARSAAARTKTWTRSACTVRFEAAGRLDADRRRSRDRAGRRARARRRGPDRRRGRARPRDERPDPGRRCPRALRPQARDPAPASASRSSAAARTRGSGSSSRRLREISGERSRCGSELLQCGAADARRPHRRAVGRALAAARVIEGRAARADAAAATLGSTSSIMPSSASRPDGVDDVERTRPPRGERSGRRRPVPPTISLDSASARSPAAIWNAIRLVLDVVGSHRVRQHDASTARRRRAGSASTPSPSRTPAAEPPATPRGARPPYGPTDHEAATSVSSAATIPITANCAARQDVLSDQRDHAGDRRADLRRSAVQERSRLVAAIVRDHVDQRLPGRRRDALQPDARHHPEHDDRRRSPTPTSRIRERSEVQQRQHEHHRGHAEPGEQPVRQQDRDQERARR